MKRVFVHEYASGWQNNLPVSIVAEGRAMRDALCLDLAATGMYMISASAGVASPPNGIARFDPRPGEMMDDFLRRAAKQTDIVWPIAPESGGVALSIARTLATTGIMVAGPTPGAIALASSKITSLTEIAAHNIETVPTWPLHSAPLRPHQLWAIKPDCGCGCEGVLHLDADTARRWRSKSESLIAQPWVEGEAASLSVLAFGKQIEVLAVNRQHLDISADGKVQLTKVTRHPAPASTTMQKLAAGVTAALPGLRGYFGIDFVLRPDGSCVVVEVNPRLTSAYIGLSAHLGRNIGGEILTAMTTGIGHA